MDWSNFTPLSALLGGALIGSAAVALMATAGRIAGVSGFASRLLPPYTDGAFVVIPKLWMVLSHNYSIHQLL